MVKNGISYTAPIYTLSQVSAVQLLVVALRLSERHLSPLGSAIMQSSLAILRLSKSFV